MMSGGGKVNVITINQTISDPYSMVGGDVNGDVIQWIRSNSHRVLAKKTAEGKITYCRLDDSNSNLYHDGSAAKLDGTEGDVFVKLPTFYYYGTEGDNIEITFSNKPFDGCVEWDTNILIGAYKAVVKNKKVYSKSGVIPMDNVIQADFKKYAQARGTGYQLVDWQMHCVLGCLYYAMYGNTNCQATIGDGHYNQDCGQTNTLGMTDTNGGVQHINFWGLEDWWGSMYEWMEDDQFDPYASQFPVYDPVTKGTRNVPIEAYQGGFVKKMKFGRYLDLVITECDDWATAGSTSYCDYQQWSTGSDYIANTRSYADADEYGGVAFVEGIDVSYTNSQYGSRLAFRGECTEETDVTTFKKMPISFKI